MGTLRYPWCSLFYFEEVQKLGRYMCVKKTYQWGRLFNPGDIIELPVGVALPHGVIKKPDGTEEKDPYLKFIGKPPGKVIAPVSAKPSVREIKILKNRLSALYARTNLTPGEEAEKGRIQNRIAMIDVGTSLGTRITKEEVVKKKEKEVEAAAGTRSMSMAETQKMKHDKYDKAQAEKE